MVTLAPFVAFYFSLAVADLEQRFVVSFTPPDS